MVASGELAKDAVYTHPQRNLIYRSLGHQTVEMDIFHENLQDGDVLLLCSDGLWEMTRDSSIEQILGSSQTASEMTDQLVHLALKGGGADNIGCLVCKCCMEDVAGMQTVLISLAPEVFARA
jgi:protein phosphatase